MGLDLSSGVVRFPYRNGLDPNTQRRSTPNSRGTNECAWRNHDARVPRSVLGLAIIVRNGYALFTRREFLGAWFSALLTLAPFDPGVATAQQGKEIKLTEKHI